MERTYVIINTTEIDDIDFNAVLQDSPDTLRRSLDGTQALVKFEGDTPSCLSGKEQLNRSETLSLMATSEWTELELTD
jgi:hypothetical protein